MTKDEFWNLIEKSKTMTGEGDCYDQAAILQSLLEECSPADIAHFDEIYDQMRLDSNDRRLWAAAYIINGGCSEEGFEYFRGWLISRGREVFEKAVQDPRTLISEVPDEEGELECEDMLYVARNAYEKKTGSPLPARPPLEANFTGDAWDEETVDALYPELAKAADARWA